VQFYLLRNGNTFGPYTADDVRDHIASGDFSIATDRFWHDELKDWKPLTELPFALATPQQRDPTGWIMLGIAVIILFFTLANTTDGGIMGALNAFPGLALALALTLGGIAALLRRRHPLRSR
jgi:hypothetical protein